MLIQIIRTSLNLLFKIVVKLLSLPMIIILGTVIVLLNLFMTIASVGIGFFNLLMVLGIIISLYEKSYQTVWFIVGIIAVEQVVFLGSGFVQAILELLKEWFMGLLFGPVTE